MDAASVTPFLSAFIGRYTGVQSYEQKRRKGLARSYWLEEMGMNHHNRLLLLLLNESFTCLNAELKQKQLTLQPEIERLKIK
jgi:hypothetical protein